MCGIAGIVSFKDRNILKYISLMLSSIRHRGPDGEGYLFLNNKDAPVCFGGGDTSFGVYKSAYPYAPKEPFKGMIPEDSFAALGHRLLSIIDLSPASHQPMSNEDKSLWIIYNGEIYNYIEIREELKERGHRFNSNTDTEVLLKAYQEWGKDCLGKFNGMWSFVIYDKKKNIFFGARDRFGIKPFYYFQNEDCFAFASEVKALALLPFIEKKMNIKIVFDYLTFGITENEEETIFKGIFELMPSYAFEFDLSKNNFKKWKYYGLNYNDEWEIFDKEKISGFTRKTRDLIFDAVKLRLHSEVPVGSCLSGGIDSSVIVCATNDIIKGKSMIQIGDRQKVFTSCYAQEAIDESRWAELVVGNTNASWFKVFPKADELLEDLEDLIYTQDIPFNSTSVYAQYRVMKFAKESGIKVLLDGQGGDELFTGYDIYHINFFSEILKHFDLAAFLREFWHLNGSTISRGAVLKSIIKRMLPYYNKIKKMKLVGVDYLNSSFLKENEYRIKFHEEETANSLNRMLFKGMSEGSLKEFLRYEDRNSMRFSVEARTPFADDVNLIENIFKIPSIYKIHNGLSKYLLRESMRYLIPERIRLRKDKIGFATPERLWLNEIKNELKNYITDDLKEYINISAVLKDWDNIFTHAPGSRVNIWRFINFAVWKNIFKM